MNSLYYNLKYNIPSLSKTNFTEKKLKLYILEYYFNLMTFVIRNYFINSWPNIFG